MINQDVIARMLLLFLGTMLIILAIGLRHRLSGARVIDFSWEKLGVALKVDAFGLVVLIGFIMVAWPLFFWYKGYEDRVSHLQQQVEGLSVLTAELKEHELRFNLVFLQDQYPNLRTIKWPPVAYVQRVGERAEKPYDLANFERGPGGIVASIRKLRLGDRLYIVVEDRENTWRSFDMTTPGAQLEMKQVEADK